jgi:hypothetical protein
MAFQYAQHKFPAFWAEQASPSYFPILSSARLDLVVHCAWEREKSILMNKVRILKKNYIENDNLPAAQKQNDKIKSNNLTEQSDNWEI